MAVELRPWAPDDLPVLERNDTPEMTAYLGGPEGPEALRRRHEKFLREQAAGVTWPFAVVAPGEPDPVGSFVYWETEHDGAPAYECGWAIALEHQGRGFATSAVRAGVEHAARNGDRNAMWAFPRVDNLPSNALARATGFLLEGEQDFEYPKGVPIRVNAWVVDLADLRGRRG